MKYYMAPMEGVTGYQYRMTYHQFYQDADRYFTPFLVGKKLSAREKSEVSLTNNAGMNLIPQILTNRADEFVYVANHLKWDYGYEEVNLNLGCPSGTVASKNRGSGFLRVLDELEEFLDYIYANAETKISIKTRIGVEDASNWPEILDLYLKYPMSELIVHPRTQKQGYGGAPDLEAFALAVEKLAAKEQSSGVHIPLIYNGNVNSVADRDLVADKFPTIDGMMCARGMIADPGLIPRLMRTPIAKPTEVLLSDLRKKERDGLAKYWTDEEVETFRSFMNAVFQTYKKDNLSEKNMLFKVKELWSYWYKNFGNADQVLREVQKSTGALEYGAAVNNAFRTLR